MKTKLYKTKKIYLVIIVLLATAGSIFFFPMNIGGRYTCFYHRIFDPSHPVSETNVPDHHQMGNVELSKSGNHDLHNQVSGNNKNNTMHHGSVLLDNYLYRYAIPWWASMGLLALGIYFFLKLRKNFRGKESNLTSNQ